MFTNRCIDTIIRALECFAKRCDQITAWLEKLERPQAIDRFFEKLHARRRGLY